MDNFTNSGLTELLVKVIHRYAPEAVTGIRSAHPMTQAVQPDTAKRQIIQNVLKTHGPGMLLRVGQHLRDIDPTPVFTALTSTLDPDVIAVKWMRLERYNHASHRTAIDITTPGRWSCTRTSKSTPPTQGENYLIAGVLFGLLTLTGVGRPTLHVGGLKLTPASLDMTRRPPAAAETFAITWDPPDETDTPTDTEPSRQDATSQRLTDLLSQDMARGWRIDEAARALGKSKRTLQRELHREGSNYSIVMRQARMNQATKMLTGPSPSLAEIGYCCGYADQAHFQRDFLTAANITPGQYIRILNITAGN